jgi:hypothetical protein
MSELQKALLNLQLSKAGYQASIDNLQINRSTDYTWQQYNVLIEALEYQINRLSAQ